MQSWTFPQSARARALVAEHPRLVRARAGKDKSVMGGAVVGRFARLDGEFGGSRRVAWAVARG